MKKITLLTLLLISFITNAQTFSIYTQDSSIGAGVNSLRFQNGNAFTGSEPTTTPYEGSKNYLLTYTGSGGTYFHGIFLPRNTTNTADMTIDLSAYSYYNIAIKTTSATQFYIRMRGNGITAKVLINPASNSYSFTNDGQWHFMSIPFSAFIPESGSFSLATISEALVFRSYDTTGVVITTSNDFAFDNVYVSTTQINLGTNKINTLSASIYPNPATNVLKISSVENVNKIIIYNLLGVKVLEKNSINDNDFLDISSLSVGSYIVNVESAGKKYSTKLIKK